MQRPPFPKSKMYLAMRWAIQQTNWERHLEEQKNGN